MFGLKSRSGNQGFGGFLRRMFSVAQSRDGRNINQVILKGIIPFYHKLDSAFGTRNYSCVDPCSHLKQMDINCKTALVTGGTRGIGLAISDALLAAGLKKVYVAGQSRCNGAKAEAELTRKHGKGRVEYAPLDVNNYKHFEDTFKDIINEDGSVDILVNNAGILNDKEWESEIDTNVKGVMRGILLANKYMPSQKNKGGCVVNISSILGYDTFPYTPGYSCTKYAVVGLTKCFGNPGHYSKNKVRILAVGPGITLTDMVYNAQHMLLEEEWGKESSRALESLPTQKTDAVGRGVVYMVEYAPPGSLWVIEDRKLQRVIPPERKTYQTKVLDL